MQILLVSAYGLPHMGGIEVAVDALAAELSERGHTVTHVTSSADGEGADEPSSSYAQIRIPSLNPLETRLGVPYPLFGLSLLTRLQREIARADVVHAHGFIYPGSVLAAALTSRTKPATPMVLTEHVGHVPYDSALLNRIEGVVIRALGARVLRRADAVIAYNARVADELMKLCPSITPVSILNGVDIERFHPPEDGERARLRAELGWDDGPRVLFVGRPVAKKGFGDAVRAVRDAELPGIQLVVVGADKLPAGTPERVIPLGWLSRERLAELYRACDAMIMPARGEGFPLAAQEALASGLPLVLADDPGYAPSLAGVGPGARAVENPAGFSGALDDLMGDRASLEEASRAATAHAREAFSWERTATEHEALYEELLSPASQPS